jgi:uncharacterized protein
MTDFPKFPHFRPIELSDREPVEAIFRALRPEVSELCFTNLFMFKHVHDYKISSLNGNLLIYAKSYKGEYYFFPPIGGNNIPETMSMQMDYMRGRDEMPVVNLASAEFIKKYVEGAPEYKYELSQEDSDYVYSTAELISLSGRKFHDKKNLLNRFLKRYAPEYRRLTQELVPQAKDLVDRWCRDKCAVNIPSTFGEAEATQHALDHLSELSTIGGVVLVGGIVEALSLGELLNENMAVVHVEKANQEFSGLYQYISSEFLRQEFSDVEFVNREQDLGEPNLRKSKQSYNPIRMVEKFKVWPKE